MAQHKTCFHKIRVSLRDLLGGDYIDAVCAARAGLSGEDHRELIRSADQPVDLFPNGFHDRLLSLLGQVGQPISNALAHSANGATTAAFEAATRTHVAPLTGLGYYRVGQDGRLCFISKSEHYHAPVGHGFPGYRLVEVARRLGIPNATHNNTRGHITRLLEEELIRTANGAAYGADVSAHTGQLDRVLNFETGSLAAEAALKLILSRFYQSQPDAPEPKYRRRTPVLIVVGDDDGALQANYHGTTMLAQMLRGMWPELAGRLEDEGILLVRAVRPNCLEDVDRFFAEYERQPYKVAGFIHEIVMMNYGAKLLTRDFLARVYKLCQLHDVPTAVDEIQTCLWHRDMYMFREYGLAPGFVVVGKGFAAGEYAASRLLFRSQYDSLPQFGALVTNGQEELASLVYLITMRWAQCNADVTEAIGDYFEQRLRDLADAHPSMIVRIEGRRHCAAVCFEDANRAKAFTASLNELGIDISVQTYKASGPPAAMLKPPLIAGYEAIDMLIEKMESVLRAG